jgi:large subunit ribosomal protein L32
MSACSKCGVMVMPHRMCKACGSYKGRTVVEA